VVAPDVARRTQVAASGVPADPLRDAANVLLATTEQGVARRSDGGRTFAASNAMRQ